ncbi:MAG: riboflavin synthase [Saprospiraceae bacterium]|nr:riboflavin synthase [Saprospiraceae bacterium]
MFSGITESTGVILKIEKDGSNKHFTISSPFNSETYIDQSIAHNGVCLTVIQTDSVSYIVTAVQETLAKTNLRILKEGDQINLERSLHVNGRIDGHFVQGHVDATSECKNIEELDGSWFFYFTIAKEHQKYLVNKGSVCVNGVSLTVVETKEDFFNVAVIPYTLHHTNFKNIKVGDLVNLEFDILGKYIINYLKQAAFSKKR